MIGVDVAIILAVEVCMRVRVHDRERVSMLVLMAVYSI